MKCPKCGKELADDSVFCEFCGAEIVNPNNRVACKVDVRVPLYASTILIALSNLLFILFTFYTDISFYWLLVPLLSLCIAIIGFVLYKKKRLSLLFTIFLFAMFGLNTAIYCAYSNRENITIREYSLTLHISDNTHGIDTYAVVEHMRSQEEANELEQRIGACFDKSVSIDYIHTSGMRTIGGLGLGIILFFLLEFIMVVFYAFYYKKDK